MANGGAAALTVVLKRIDTTLLALPRPLQLAAIIATIAFMTWQSLPNVPREFTDLSRFSALRDIQQTPVYGTDTIADTYEAKVILNAPADMYTKTQLAQTLVEAETWSKAASAPYPPAVLLAEAGLYAVGHRLGIELYGMILICAAAFVGMSAWYFLQTRWYLFPLLYLNFTYFSERFVAVQDGSYLVMLVIVMGALLLARAGASACHGLIAVAIDMKLSPLFYAANLLRMPRRAAAIFIAVIVAGLVLPYFIWDNYLYIFTFHEEIKGSMGGLAAGLVFGVMFSVLLLYVQARRGFDWEERIGWGLLPMGMFLAMKMNVPRHVLILLLVPDKTGTRNIIAAIALALHALAPDTIRFGDTLSIATVLLFSALAWQLRTIGWETVREDLRRPAETLPMMFLRQR